jgi:hypothetical protein
MSELALLGFYTLNNGAGPVSNAALPLLMDEPRNGLREFSQTQIGRLTGAGNWSVNRATTETQFASGPRSWTLTTRTFRQGVEAWNRGCPEFVRQGVEAWNRGCPEFERIMESWVSRIRLGIVGVPNSPVLESWVSRIRRPEFAEFASNARLACTGSGSTRSCRGMRVPRLIAVPD